MRAVQSVKKIEDFESAAMIAELQARGDMPEPKISDINDDDLIDEVERRDLHLAEESDALQDSSCLDKAVDYARWGDFGMAGYFLVQAVPGLHPIGKILGA